MPPPSDAALSAPAARVVVMGVSGCGKSTVGRALAELLGWRFLEGDQLHPPANVARMAAGIPLTDEDREGWLERIGIELAQAAALRLGMVASCSALKRSYRDLLRAAEPGLRFVHLHGPRELLAERLAARTRHYMPASLLQSQLATLEPPGEEEGALSLPIGPPPAELARAAAAWLQTTGVPR
jgi:carbohydrate kinase (thermoresistant glucokinase family)